MMIYCCDECELKNCDRDCPEFIRWEEEYKDDLELEELESNNE